MPELPEVETVVRDLRPLIVGQTITAVRVGKQQLRRPWKKAWATGLTGATVTAISRRGKWIVVELAGEPRLLVHLGMTGQLTVATTETAVPTHTHVILDFAGETHQLRFRDTRRFGSMELFPDAIAVQNFLAERLGPEPDALDATAFRAAIRGSARTLKAILLDQAVVAGVGNIYADEALHRAGLHPERRGKSLTDAEIDQLRETIPVVIAHAIELRGSTIRDYIGGSGLRGGFQDEFRAYGRAGEPCLTCGAKMELVRVAGRASHFCPRCQPLITAISQGTISTKTSQPRRSPRG